MHEYLYRLTPTRPEMVTDGGTERENELLQAHFAYLATLLEQDTLNLAGRTSDDDQTTFGIVLFNAPDRKAAEAIMCADPAVQHEIMSAELFPFRTALSRNQ